MVIDDRAFDALIRTGSLTVIWPDGRRATFGDGTAPAATLRFHTRRAVWRVSLSPDLAFGECYMDGSLTAEDCTIHDVLDVLILNMGCHRGPPMYLLRRILARPISALTQRNAPHQARQRIAHHYDLSADLYALFLDDDRQYSCAYFGQPGDDLTRAQQRKKSHIAAKLLLQPGQRVLDIGCGWGGMALSLAKAADVEVVGVTLSDEQLKVARERAAAEGVADRVRFELIDYRLVTGTFDRIVSVGMLEHVGRPHLGEYFNAVYRLLRPNGVALIHTIGRSDGPGATNPWIDKYIFPGGYSPALSEILLPVERSDLILTDVEVLRLHYAETLRAWRHAFLANREAAKSLYDETFCRMWEFYLASSEVSFRYAGLVNFQLQLAKGIHAVPLTRDYIHAEEARLEKMHAAADTGEREGDPVQRPAADKIIG